MSGDLLYFEAFERSRNSILNDVVRGGFLGEVVERLLSQPRWKILRYVITTVGDGTALAALYRNAPVSNAGHVGA